jgi:hypothetical protein
MVFQYSISSPSIFAQSKLQKNVEKISRYIIYELNENKNVLEQIDSIYAYALKINDACISETLLSLTFATIPYNTVPIFSPMFKIRINYPIVSASEDIFLLKNKRLPHNFFIDSPSTYFGDKDKLAHFFGSAFISYNSLFFDLTPLIGYFVEAFEEVFVVDSSIDERDLLVNKLGSEFGQKLVRNKTQMPSEQIFLYSLNKLMIKTCLTF